MVGVPFVVRWSLEHSSACRCGDRRTRWINKTKPRRQGIASMFCRPATATGPGRWAAGARPTDSGLLHQQDGNLVALDTARDHVEPGVAIEIGQRQPPAAR